MKNLFRFEPDQCDKAGQAKYTYSYMSCSCRLFDHTALNERDVMCVFVQNRTASRQFVCMYCVFLCFGWFEIVLRIFMVRPVRYCVEKQEMR